MEEASLPRCGAAQESGVSGVWAALINQAAGEGETSSSPQTRGVWTSQCVGDEVFVYSYSQESKERGEKEREKEEENNSVGGWLRLLRAMCVDVEVCHVFVRKCVAGGVEAGGCPHVCVHIWGRMLKWLSISRAVLRVNFLQKGKRWMWGKKERNGNQTINTLLSEGLLYNGLWSLISGGVSLDTKDNTLLKALQTNQKYKHQLDSTARQKTLSNMSTSTPWQSTARGHISCTFWRLNLQGFKTSKFFST